MSKPRLLDLFCGAGGCTKDYQFAGFDVVGVDIKPQPHYCGDEFYLFDALRLSPIKRATGGACFHAEWRCIGVFDAIHASPPCQAYSAGKNMWKGRLPDERHPDLVAATKERLKASGVPYVIENVEGAPLENYITLCGDMFGLGVKRHRLFETSWFIWNPPVCRAEHPEFVASVFGGGALSRTPAGGSTTNGMGNFMQRRVHVDHEQAKVAMGIDWMTRDELSQAIPPAYTAWIGERLLEHLKVAAA